MVEMGWVSVVGAMLVVATMTAIFQWGVKKRWLLTEAQGPENRKMAVGMILCMAAVAGAAFLFHQYGYGFWKQMKYFVILCGVLLAAYADQKERRIPNRFLLILCGIRVILLTAEIIAWPTLWSDFLTHALGGAVGSFLLMLAAWYLSRRSIGLGDVKLLTVTGSFLGFSLNYISLFLGLLFAAIYGVTRVLRKKIKIRDEIAFAPFLAAGIWAALLIGL